MTENTAHTLEQYVEFWNAAHTDGQRAAGTFTDGVSYHAPAGVLRGVGELAGFRDRFAQQSPEYEFRPRTPPQTHHDRARLQWELLVSGRSFAEGTDILEFDTDNRITSISTFLDRAPEGAH